VLRDLADHAKRHQRAKRGGTIEISPALVAEGPIRT
jgi:hypothetical protein